MYDVGAGLTLQKMIEILLRQTTVDTLAIRSKAEQNQKNRNNPTTCTNLKCDRPSGGSASTGTDNCSYCNRKHPPGKKNCPAAKTNCKKCNKVGYFAVACRRSLAVREVLQDGQLGEDDCFVSGVRDKSQRTCDTYLVK